MKKTFTSIMALLLSSALVCGFVSCKNNDDDSPSAPVSKTTPAVSTTGTVSAATTNASGQKTATLTASNGSYTFTETSSGANASVASRAAVDSTKGGEWTFTETNSSTPKYSGIYKGDISKFGSKEVKLILTVKKVLSGGKLTEVISAKEFDFEATTTGFTATVPEVEAKQAAAPISGGGTTPTVTLPDSVGENPFNGKTFKQVITGGDALKKEKTWSFDGSTAKETIIYTGKAAKEINEYNYAYDAEKSLLFLALKSFSGEGDGETYTCSTAEEWGNLQKKWDAEDGEPLSQDELDIEVCRMRNIFATRTVYQYSISENSITFTPYFDGSLPTIVNFHSNDNKLLMNMGEGLWLWPNDNDFNNGYHCEAPNYAEGSISGKLYNYTRSQNNGKKSTQTFFGEFEATYTTEGKGTTGCSIKITFTKLPAGITDFTTGTEYTLTN